MTDHLARLKVDYRRAIANSHTVAVVGINDLKAILQDVDGVVTIPMAAPAARAQKEK